MKLNEGGVDRALRVLLGLGCWRWCSWARRRRGAGWACSLS
jgi:hypothetical protein